MGLPAKTVEYYSVEEYLELEKTSDVRHEYVDGQIYAMSGVSKNHARLTGRIYARFDSFLDDQPCEPYHVDVKVQANPTRYYYPDVVVTCEAATLDKEDDYLIVQPLLIVEVLSKSTERIDRIEKMNAYQNISGLLEYVIVDQYRMRIEMYRHQNAGDVWRGEVFTDPDEHIFFESIGVRLSLADIYRRVIFSTQSEGEPNR